ncbi:Bug family tripartite tricarboxylate transporter substrate binding protein [Parvibium lacunae]|uniref:Tripartite tricarboxylate transporter substrate binding protein n=1 Tax=Parvibium lacunae TaxID=1888893 RepID=A0A368L1P5_9BURK|nr:tripartite tricarboxylate transporter substrate-binding protein [Parvibium lacunae]RCS57012.1 tripartite tricarboxylate transporter substrate binding protein [Parvibium lacunae]
MLKKMLTIGLSCYALNVVALDNVKIMIGANPGGGYDQTARGIGAALQAAGQAKAVQYENRGGAGGTIGLAQFVNTSKGDPNALVVVGAVMVGAIETNKSPVNLKDVTPVARLLAEYDVLVVPANSKIQTLKDLIAAVKANPGAVSWGGGSKGSIDHILAGLILKASDVDPTKLNYVPFAGGGEAAAAILGGHVTIGISGLAEFLPYIKSGKMRALGVSADKRVPEVDIPTLREQGTPVSIANWRGVYGAPGISADQQAALIKAVTAATQTKQWQDTLDKNEWQAALLTGDELAKFADTEQQRIGAILRVLGLVK